MNNKVKYALVFTAGVAVGIGATLGNIVNYALDDMEINEILKIKMARKLDSLLFKDKKKNNKTVSYGSYYNRDYRERRTYGGNIQ